MEWAGARLGGVVDPFLQGGMGWSGLERDGVGSLVHFCELGRMTFGC